MRIFRQWLGPTAVDPLTLPSNVRTVPTPTDYRNQQAHIREWAKAHSKRKVPLLIEDQPDTFVQQPFVDEMPIG